MDNDLGLLSNMGQKSGECRELLILFVPLL